MCQMLLRMFPEALGISFFILTILTIIEYILNTIDYIDYIYIEREGYCWGKEERYLR